MDIKDYIVLYGKLLACAVWRNAFDLKVHYVCAITNWVLHLADYKKETHTFTYSTSTNIR